jgi:hypothetical protein
VPHLDNSLRHILALKGIETTASDENKIQTAKSLPVLLKKISGAIYWRGIFHRDTLMS